MKQPEEVMPEPDTNALRHPASHVRAGWAEASKVEDVGDDSLVMGEFGNQDDEKLS